MPLILNVIVKVKGGWVVKSKKGKRLSRVYRSRAAAERRLRQIEAFKHMKQNELARSLVPVTTNQLRRTTRIDPSRTTTLRRSFMAEMRRRFRKIRRAVRERIEVLDVYGLDEENPNRVLAALAQNQEPREFQFLTNPQKLQNFRRWLQDQIDTGILGPVSGIRAGGEPWTARFINSAHRRGVVRAWIQTHAAGLAQRPEFYEGSRAQFLRDAFAQPVMISKIELLATRSFEALRGVTQTMATQMNRVMADALSQGLGAADAARNLAREVSQISRTRAMAIARTEIVHAHAEGQLDGFQALDVDALGLLAEWQTAMDNRVCVQCAEMEGKTFTVDEARTLIPLHTNCVLGNSFVEFQDALALTRVKYFGRVVEIRTLQGKAFSVTENHVLLTREGWKPANQLTVGDQFLNTSSLDNRFTGAARPYNGNGVSSIEDVFTFLFETSPESLCVVTRSTAEDFHGDGKFCKQEIDIVFSDGKLRDCIDTELVASLVKFQLMAGNAWRGDTHSLDRFRLFSLLLHRHFSSPYCRVSRRGVSHVLFGGSSGHHKTVGMGVISNVNASVDKTRSDNVAVAPERIGDCFEALPPGCVSTDEVVQVKTIEAPRRGVFVFDIWTHDLLYSLNGIVSSNCRCAWVPAGIDKKQEAKERAQRRRVLRRRRAEGEDA